MGFGGQSFWDAARSLRDMKARAALSLGFMAVRESPHQTHSGHGPKRPRGSASRIEAYSGTRHTQAKLIGQPP